MGVTCEVLPDGIRIQGRPERQVFSGGTVDSHGDHRIAMSFAVASLRAAGADRDPRRRQRRDLVSRTSRAPRAAAGSRTSQSSRVRHVRAARVPDHHHRRAERLGQGHDRAPGRRPARLAPARQRRAVSPGGLAGQRAGPRRPTTRPATPRSPQQLDVRFGLEPRRRRADLAGRRGGQSAHPDRAGGRGRLAGRGHAGGPGGAAGAPAGLCRAPGTGRRRPRHGHGGFPRPPPSRSS